MYIFFISYRILNIHETGLMQIWKQKQWPKHNFCAGSWIKEAKHIMWVDLQTAFYLIGISTLFGVFILGSEFIFNKWRSKNTKTCNSSFCNKVAEWIWSLIWIFEYWCRWIFNFWWQIIQLLVSVDSNDGWYQRIQREMSVNSNAYIDVFKGRCKWIQRLISVNLAVDVCEFKGSCRWLQWWCQWIQMLMLMSSKVDVTDFKGRCRWIQMMISVRSKVDVFEIKRM